MSEQVFADGIGPIVVVGGTVRLDFITLVPDEGEGGSRPKPVVQHRLFMPLEAFQIAARRFSEAAEAIAKLERDQAGTRPPAAAAPAASPAPIQPAVASTAIPPAPQIVPVEPAPAIVAPSEPAPAAERPKPPFP